MDSDVTITTVQWVFGINVDERVNKFRVFCREDHGPAVHMDIIDDNSNFKNIAKLRNSHLKPQTQYHIKVLVVYEDGFESESKEQPFTSSGMLYKC